MPLWLADFVTLTHSLVLDYKTGLRGVSNVLCEIIDRQPNYEKRQVTFKMLDTRFMSLTKPYQIAPASAGIPNWSGASSGQRAQYMFIARSNARDGSGTQGTNPDGSPANTIF